LSACEVCSTQTDLDDRFTGPAFADLSLSETGT